MPEADFLFRQRVDSSSCFPVSLSEFSIIQNWKEIFSLNDLSDKFVEYDIATRWNLTFRMIDDGLKLRQQVNKFLSLHKELPRFTVED